MKGITTSTTIATGLAVFSMYFGAGNVVFPLGIGQIAKDQNFWAILGLLTTGVTLPFLGLMAITLYNGNYKEYFGKIGKIPGFIASLFIMGIIGPFGAMPRTIALSYSTTKMFVPDLSLTLFSVASCIIIFLLTYKRTAILDLLGYVLTPILLGSLIILIIKGLITSPELSPSFESPIDMFTMGVLEGYQTMDLLASFFFASVMLVCLEKEIDPSKDDNMRRIIIMSGKACLLAAFLLGSIYFGFSYIAAFHSEALMGVPTDQMVGVIALHVLGPYAGIIACVAVALACLTTAMALASVFAEYIHEDITFEKFNYHFWLVVTLVITFFVSTLEFKGIVNLLAPVLYVCYPSLIALCIVNTLHYLYGFSWIKTSVFGVFVLSILSYLL